MIVSHTTQINDSIDKVWKRLSSFDKVESYFPIVNKSSIDGKGIGSTRTCEIYLGNQTFQIIETIKDFDESRHLFTTMLREGPVQLRGMVFTFQLIDKTDKKTDLTITTEVINPDSQSMARNFFEMMGQGLKKIHEI